MAIDVGALQRQHPEWGLVDAIEAPGGGIWALGRDGGVFALDAQGNPSASTPFLGAYTQLAAADRQGDRYFVKIQADPVTGGYTLVSNRPGQTYNFVGQQRVDQPAVTTPAPPGAPAPDANAEYNQLMGALRGLGMESLIDDAWKYYKGPAGGDAQAVIDYLPTTEGYRTRFPGLKELSDQGRAWTPAQWNTYYNTAQQQAVEAGLPPGYLSREDIGKLLIGNVSAGELEGRIQAAGAAVYQADPVLIGQMRDYGFSDGDLTSFFLDPDKATPLLERKAQMAQAGIGAAARRTGYGSIGLATAQELQQLGVTGDAATEGFARLSGQHALFQNLVGEEGDITQAEQLGAQFGSDVAAQQEIETRRSRRQAQFQGGGGAATGGGGRTGLG